MTHDPYSVPAVVFLGGPHDGDTHRVPPGETFPETLARPYRHGPDHTRTYHYALTTYRAQCQTHGSDCPDNPPTLVPRYRLVREE